MIADDVVEQLKDQPMFEKAESVKPGFINSDAQPVFCIRICCADGGR